MAALKLAFSVLDEFERPKLKRRVKNPFDGELEYITDEEIEVHLSTRNVSPVRRYESEEDIPVDIQPLDVSPMNRREEYDEDIEDKKNYTFNVSPLQRREEREANIFDYNSSTKLALQ